MGTATALGTSIKQKRSGMLGSTPQGISFPLSEDTCSHPTPHFLQEYLPGLPLAGCSLFTCAQKFLHFSAVAFNIIYFNYMVSLSFSNRSFMRGALMLPSSQLCPGFLTQPRVAASNKYLLHINVSVNERMNRIHDLNLLTVKWERKTRKKTVNHYDCA